LARQDAERAAARAGAAGGRSNVVVFAKWATKLVTVTDPESSAPVLRASDAERDRAADLLREAMTSGRLSVDELDDRIRQVFAAKTRPELERLVEDVLVPAEDLHPVAARPGGVPSAEARPPVRTGEDGTRRILSILSGSKRTGRWRLAASCSVLTVLGGTELDLSAVELATDRVELKVVSVLGGAEIALPPGLNVEISETAILGGNEIAVGDAQPDPGGPVVHLRIVTILGGAQVRRRPTPSAKDRNELVPADQQQRVKGSRIAND
jgi:Domain of unknown function (DUF1707)